MREEESQPRSGVILITVGETHGKWVKPTETDKKTEFVMNKNHQSAATLRQSSAATLRQSSEEAIMKKANAPLRRKIPSASCRGVILFLFLLTSLSTFSQPKQIKTDSLARLLSLSINDDTNKVLLLLEYYRCFLPSNPDSAFKISQQIFDISTKIDYRNGIILGQNSIGNCYRHLNNPDLAIPTYQKALALAVNDKNSYLQTLICFNLGAYYGTLGVSDSAEKYQKMAISTGKALPDKNLYAKSLGHLGMVYSKKGSYIESIQSILDAIEIFKANQSSLDMANAYNVLGMIYYDLEDFEHAVSAYRLALKIIGPDGDVQLQMAVFQNLGNLYFNIKKDTDSALIFTTRELNLAQETNNEYPRLSALVTLGNIAFDEKDYEQALKIYTDVLKSPLIQYRNQAHAIILGNLGLVYLSLGNMENAEKFAKKGLQLAQEQKFVTIEQSASKTLGDIEAKKKNYQQAFEYYKKYASLFDSLSNEEVKSKVAEAVFRQTLQQKENENLLLQKDIEINKQTIQIQGFYILTASGILLLVVLLLVVNKRNNRRLHTLNNQLAMKNNELKKVSARLELATSAGGVGVWEYDLTENILLWDNEMFALYGIDKENFAGTYQAWQAAIFPDDLVKFGLEIQMAIQGEKELKTEFRILWPDGSIHNIRALATLHHHDSEKAFYLLGTNWDITEQKKSEVALLKAKADAEAANNSKSTFLANMSHEIRTPLNAIIGFSQLMNREKSLSETQKEYITSINRAGEHLLKLINDILELSKIEAGRVELKPTNFDLHALLNDMRMIFKERVHEKQLQMIFEIPDDLPKCVFADDQKLRQIFINLIGNAIKFTDHGGVTVVTRVNKVNGDTNRLIVEIQDSGPGIPEDELGKLFKQFELTSAGIRTSSGTGLGLALSLELAMLMDGNITVKSTVGKGSVFTIDVVVHDGVADGSEAVITKRVIRINNPHDIYRILVVDDKEENRQVVVSFLKLVGFQTNEAINGEEAITKFEQWNPHLILMDFRMPVMDGYEATRLIKTTEKGKQTPIIAMTASLFEDKKENTPAPQIQGYIRKPFHENELFAAIGKALGIGYIYEEETSADTPSRYLDNPGMIGEELSKLPTNFILQMQEAIEGADFHLLIHLIKTIENDNSELARHLLTKAHNYDYIYLQKILISKTSNK